MTTRTALAFFIAICLFCDSPSVFAATGTLHQITVRIKKAGVAYSQTVSVAENKQSNFTGPVRDMNMIFTTTLAKKDGHFMLDYQLELSGGRTRGVRLISLQGSLAMTQGPGATIANCGPWSVSLALDSKKHSVDPMAWQSGGPENYRLTAGLLFNSEKYSCSMVTVFGAQSDAIDRFGSSESLMNNERHRGFVLTQLLDQDLNLQYALENSFKIGKMLQLQNEQILKPGKKSTVTGSNYRLTLLLEGEPSAKKQKKGGDSYGIVSIIQ